MKLLQKSRLGIQLLFIGLTALGLFINFKIAMMIIIIPTFIWGTFFCGWVCPFGTMQDIFSKLGLALKIKKRVVPKKIHRVLQYSRYIIFILFLSVTADVIFRVMGFDPRANFEMLLLGRVSTITSLIFIFVFLVISMFYERMFCNYLCPEGAKYGLMSYFRIFRIKRNINSCIDCKKCDKSCPMNIEVSKIDSVDSIQCLNCLECISSCPVKKTLEYKVVRPKFSVKSIIVILFLVYISINMFASEGTNPTINNNDNTILSDGEYIGEGMGFRGKIKVAVTIESEKITDVVVISHREDRKWFNRANRYIPTYIIESQSTDVDVVTGATYSSLGIIDAVKDAIK